ncbi:MAG: DUF485 domain-containing protein [Deltaproteobacteria bacterium]|nr:DUF485 domain-containing protein [Deltaproteobacteria bacterium]MCW5807637.1 DUF485 domain-containing protein [Deltaproteobacteria bacterium]
MASDPEAHLRALSARRWRLSIALTIAMLAVYFGFILAVAFGGSAMGTLVLGDRVSVGIVLGAAVIAVAPILIGVYVRWANRHFDPAVAAVLERDRG